MSLRSILRVVLLATLAVGASGCELRKRMYDQPRYEPYEESDFFADRMASRLPVPGTIARGQLLENDHLYLGRVDGELVDKLPMPVTLELLERGRERYNIYCSVCHDKAGYGNGMVVQRGFKEPTSFHDQRLVESSDGYYFEVMTRGFGMMPAYSYQVKPEDRWAIVAYIRALQLSQNASVEDVPEDVRATFTAGSL